MNTTTNISALTQARARQAIIANLRFDHEWLSAGTCVTLAWERSYLDKHRTMGGRLVHEFRAFAFTQDGWYASIVVTDDQLRDICFGS